MRRSRQILLELRAEGAQQSKREIAVVKDELRRLGREHVEASIDLNERVVLRKIERVKQRLADLAKQAASPEVDLKTAAAYAHLDRLSLRLDRLRAKRVTIDVDVKRGALERAAAGVGALDRGVQRVGRGFSDAFRGVPVIGNLIGELVQGGLDLGRAFGQVAAQGVTTVLSSFQSLGALAGPIGSVVGSVVSLGSNVVSLVVVLSLLAAAASAVVTTLIALAGVAGALVASLAAATAGAGALAVAFGAALGPVLLVVVALVKRFTDVLKARKQAEQDAAQAVQQSKAAEEQRRGALDASRSAHEQLTQATVDGNRAMRDSVLELRDAQLGLESSRLGVKESRLSLLEAKKALREFVAEAGVSGPKLSELVRQFSDVEFNPAKARGILAEAGGKGGSGLDLQERILAVQRAQLGVQEATQGVVHAEQRLSDARKTNLAFQKRGIDAYRPYRQALAQARQADERLAKAEIALASAHAKHDQALKGLSATERGFLGQLDAFIAKLGALAKIVAAPIFRGLESAMQSLGKVFSDSAIQSGLERIGQALGSFFAALGQQLASDRWRGAFAQIADGAAKMIGSGGRAFRAVAEILRVVAQTALPRLLHIANRVASALEGVAQRPGAIRRTVDALIHSFRIWGLIAANVAGIVGGFLRAAKGTGDSLAQTILRLVRRWREWINSKEGQREVRKFLRESVQHVRSLIHDLPSVLAAFEKIAAVVNAIAGAVGRIQHAAGDIAKALGLGGQSFGDKIRLFVNDLHAAVKDAQLLRKHLTPEQRQETRRRLVETLTEAQGLGVGNLPAPLAALLKRLRARGLQSGGIVPGSGSGDIVPALLEPGEFVLKRAIVRQLSLPVVRALNGGSVPRLQPAAAVAGLPPIVQNNHITTTDPDPRHYSAKLARDMGRALSREAQRRGAISP